MPFTTSRSWPLLMVLALVPFGRGWANQSDTDSPPPTNSGNGAHLHGTGVFEFVNIPLAGALDSTPVSSCDWSSISLERGVFKAKRQDGSACTPQKADLTGVRFFAPFLGQKAEFIIQEVVEHTNVLTGKRSNDVPYRYRVEWRVGTRSGPLCSTKNGFALAVPYGWSSTGELQTGTGSIYFTFACIPDKDDSEQGSILQKGGVIAKCIDWGYPPWNQEKIVVFKGEERPYDVDVAALFHQACVRMAMADYCIEGAPNTLDGTPMGFADMKDLFTSTPSPLVTAHGSLEPNPKQSGYYLEAIWGISDSYRGVVPLCLGKKRWETLSLNGTCSASTSYIRKVYSTFGSIASTSSNDLSICENWDVNRLKSSGALLFSYSPFLDKALVRFRQSEGEPTYLTTSSVVMVKPGSYLGYRPNLVDGDEVPDPDDYGGYVNPVDSREQNVVQGSIFSKNIPATLHQKLNLKALYQCDLGGGRFILTDDVGCELPAGESPAGRVLEGFIYAPDASGANAGQTALYLWWNEDASAYVTSTTPPSDLYSPERSRLLGYLPPIRQLADVSVGASP